MLNKISDKNLDRIFNVYLVVCLLFYLISYAYLHKLGNPTSPDNTINLLVSDLFSNFYTLSYYENLNTIFDTYIFGFRGFAFNEETGRMVHVSMHGYPLILGYLKMLGPNLIYSINALSITVSVFYIYKFGLLTIRDRQYAILAAIIYSVLAPIIYNSNVLFNNALHTALFLASYYYLSSFIKYRHTSALFLGVVFAFVTFWIRYDSVIYYIPIGILLATNIKDQFKQVSITSLLVTLVMIFPLSVINKQMYGSLVGFTTPGLRLTTYILERELQESKGAIATLLQVIFNAELTNIPNNVIDHIFRIAPLIVLPAVIGFFFFLRKKKDINLKILGSLNWSAALLIFFYFRGVWSGSSYEEVSVATSYSRYMMPLWAIIVLLYVYSFKSLAKEFTNKVILKLILLLVITYSFSVSINGLYGLSFFQQQQDEIEKIKEQIDDTPENSIIFTRTRDKYIYPKRLTAIYMAYHPDDRVDSTTQLVKDLLLDEIPVYFTTETDNENPLLIFLTDIKRNGMNVEFNKEELLWQVTLK